MSKTINAACLSGGAARISYECGCLNWIYKKLTEPIRVFSGTSCGAQLSAILAQGKTLDQQKLYLKKANQLIDSVSSPKDIFLKRGILKHIDAPGLLDDFISGLGARGVYDWTPLRKVIESSINPALVRNSGNVVRIGVCSFNSSQFKAIDETHARFAQYVYASSLMPIIAEPIELDGELWWDGGIAEQLPLKSAFDAIETIYNPGDQVNLFVILSTPIIPDWKPSSSFKNILDGLLGYIDTAQANTFREDIGTALEKNTKPGKINANIIVFEPSRHFYDGLAFNQVALRDMKQHGEKEAAKEWP